jgi:hypothetical protein
MRESISMITYLVSRTITTTNWPIFILVLMFPICILSRGLTVFSGWDIDLVASNQGKVRHQ